MRFLVAEDDRCARLAWESLLSRYGDCEVVDCGTDAVDALDRAFARGISYDLLLLDLQMPGCDGSEVVEHLRVEETRHAVDRPATVVIATAVDPGCQSVESLMLDIDAYLTKPVSPNELTGALSDLGMLD